MKRNATIAVALYLAALGTGIEARAADCQKVRGSDVETIVRPIRYLCCVIRDVEFASNDSRL